MSSRHVARKDQARTLLKASRAVDASGTTTDPWILIAGDRIEATGTGQSVPFAHTVVDLGDATLTPGFIDLHSHGGAGESYDADMSSGSSALAMHRSRGTTRSVLSLVSAPIDALEQSLSQIRALMLDDELILGAHLEGPFLAADNRGAHDPQHLRAPTPDLVDRLIDAGEGVLKQVTIAPELEGALEAIRSFAEHGIAVAVGHTQADYALTTAAFDVGARILTHAFNAMPGIHHRRPGPIMAAASDPRITLELVLDAVHVHPTVAGGLFRLAPGRIALITDAMAAAGAPDGSYELGSLDVKVVGGVARLVGSDTIAGSTLTQDQALRMAVTAAGLDFSTAVGALTNVPARTLGLESEIGLLKSGFTADIVVLSPTLQVQHVWARGFRLS